MNIIIGIVGKQNIKFIKLEALLRHNNKIFNERRPFISNLFHLFHLFQYIAFCFQNNFCQSSAKPRLPRMFEFIKYIGIIYGVISIWEVTKNKDIF